MPGAHGHEIGRGALSDSVTIETEGAGLVKGIRDFAQQTRPMEAGTQGGTTAAAPPGKAPAGPDAKGGAR